MTNHPKRAAAYEVRHLNGKFSTVRGKDAAFARARLEAGCDDISVNEAKLDSEWGVRVIRLTPAEAKARGV